MSAEPNATAPTNADPVLPPPSTDTVSEKQASNTSAAPEKPSSSSHSKHISVPCLPFDVSPISLIKTTDSTINRLNTLLRTSAGLSSFLSTANYALYILAHAHLTSPTRAQVIATLRTTLGLPASKIPPGALKPTSPTSPVLPLALTLGELRTTLRLTGLIPLYVLLKSLIKTRNQAKDKITYAIQLAQALSYIAFQALENINLLTNKTVIDANWTNTRFARLGGNAGLVTWSCRAWCAGVVCDFLSLARQAQLSRRPGSEYRELDADAKREADKKFWTTLFVASSWFPMALHYSINGGIGMNLGMVGASGFFANLANFLRLWEATKA